MFEISLLFLAIFHQTNYVVANCGCREVRGCYSVMWDTLTYRDESKCIADASMGTSSHMVYLRAIQKFCPEFIEVRDNSDTSDGRSLYEVVINIPLSTTEAEENKPVILIDAGQRGGMPPVVFAFYIIEQLIACEESTSMITNAKWVILPSTNPDGLEWNRFGAMPWFKNREQYVVGYNITGVDISRNFDHKWEQNHEYAGSQTYAGPNVNSEIETKFINEMLQKYKHKLKLYLSLRRDGHDLLYPYGDSKSSKITANDTIIKVASIVSARVNQICGSVQMFLNSSIFDRQGKSYFGHSVDYAFDMEIPLTYEMRVFMNNEGDIISMFHPLPLRFENSLLRGYYRGIVEFYHIVSNPRKYGFQI